MTGLVYCLKNKTNNKKYIGQTTDLTERMRCHRKDAGRGRKGVDAAINKYGWDSFEVVILENNIPVDNLTKREKHWIGKYNTFEGRGYNLTNGEDAMRGKDNYMYGREPVNKGTTLLKEERQKISEWTKGTVPTGSKHPFADLTIGEAKEILEVRIDKNLSMHKLAKRFDRSAFTINKIIDGDHWTIEEGNLEDLANEAEDDMRQKVTKPLCEKIIKYKNEGLTYQEIRERLDIDWSKNTLWQITTGKHPLAPVIT